MRTSIKASRRRLLAVVAGALVAGSALGAITMPAQAVVNTITVVNPDANYPAALVQAEQTAFDIPVTVQETDPTAQLTLAVQAQPDLPPASTLQVSQLPGPGGGGVDVTGTIPGFYTGNLTVTATDNGSAASGFITFPFKVQNAITLTSPGNQTTTIGVPLAAPLPTVLAADTDALAGVTFADGGTLPAGLAIDPASGAISGTPTTAGSYQVAITATDSHDLSVTKTTVFTWTVTNVVHVTAPATEQSIAGLPIKQVTVTATDSTPADALTFSSPDLPAGLLIGKTSGIISGTPTAKPTTYTVHVVATDKFGSAGTAVIHWTIGKQNAIAITALAPKVIYHGVAASVKVSVTDSDKTQKTFKWKVSNLPPGMGFSTTSMSIYGRPQRDALFLTTLSATDGTGATGTINVRFDVTNAIAVIDLDPRLSATTAGHGTIIHFTTKDAVKGERVSKLTAAGLPPGMQLGQNPAMVYGWPTKPGKYSLTIEAFGSLGSTDSLRNVPLTVQAAGSAGATGQLKLILDGKCLQAPKGAAVEITNCVAGNTEKWTIASDGSIRNGGHCLDISGTSSYSGKGVQLATCTASPRELWTQAARGQLVNPASGLCLTDPGARTGNGVVPVVGGCTGKPYEQWALPRQQVQTLFGTCLDDLHSVGTNGAIVDKYACNGTVAQTWSFGADNTIHGGQYPSDCLTSHNGKIALYLCQKGNKSQLWSVVPVAGLGSGLMQNGMCVSMPKLTAADGTQLVLGTCNASSPLDLWHIW
jgi:hypothetical protein